MSDYNTGNPVPSIDPRDLDDNATALDSLVNGAALTYADRLGVNRMSVAGMRALVASFTSANVAALSALVGAPNLGLMFTGVGSMATYALTAFGRTLAGSADAAAARASLGLGALATASTAAIANGGTGAADASTARTNLGLGTLSTLNTAPLAQGGTGATTAAAARTNLGLNTAATAALGTSGNTVPLLNAVNVWSAQQSISVVTPITDGGGNCGTASLRWATVFAQTGAINTSDAREKTEPRDFSEAEVRTAIELSRGIKLYRWLDAVKNKGDLARLHSGMTVQDAMGIFEREGLDPFAYGVICHDTWAAEGATPKGDLYGFRYDELNLWIAAGISARIDVLEQEA